MQIDAIAMNDNSDDGKPWVRSTDAVNLNLTQFSFTQASQAEPSSSQVLFGPLLSFARKCAFFASDCVCQSSILAHRVIASWADMSLPMHAYLMLA